MAAPKAKLHFEQIPIATVKEKLEKYWHDAPLKAEAAVSSRPGREPEKAIRSKGTLTMRTPTVRAPR